MEVFESSTEIPTEQTLIVVSRRKRILGFIKRSGILIKSIFLYPFKKIRTKTNDSKDDKCLSGLKMLKGNINAGCLGMFNMRGVKRPAVTSINNPSLFKTSESTSNSSSIYNPNAIEYNSIDDRISNNSKVESIVKDINREIDENNRIVDKTIFKDCSIRNFEIGNTIGTGSYATVCIAKFNKNFDLNSDLLGYKWFEEINGFKGSKEIIPNNSYKSKSLIANIADNISNLLGTSKSSKKTLNNTVIGCETEINDKNGYFDPYSSLNLTLGSKQNEVNNPYFKVISNLNSSSDLDLKLKLNLDNNNNNNSNINNINNNNDINNNNNNSNNGKNDFKSNYYYNKEENKKELRGNNYSNGFRSIKDSFKDDCEYSSILSITESYEENNRNCDCYFGIGDHECDDIVCTYKEKLNKGNNNTNNNYYYNRSITTNNNNMNNKNNFNNSNKVNEEKQRQERENGILRRLLIKKEEIEIQNKREELLNEETKIVALKILNKVKIIRTKQLDHVKSEADILSRFNHPFIVGYYGRFQDTQNLYFILEFVGGGELFYYLRKVSRFSADTVRFYCSQVLLALDFLHSQGVVYRDLKPENILLDYIGYIRLVDFGFAKCLISENDKLLSRTLTNNTGYTDSRISLASNNTNRNDHENYTNTNKNNNINNNNKDNNYQFNYNSYNNMSINGLQHNYNGNISRCSYNRIRDRTYTICGTCEYLAPEVFLKKGHGLQADFYSFGVLLYELLVGVPPFYSQDPQLTYSLALRQNIDFPRYIDRTTKDIIKKLLKVDPNKRLGNNIKDIYKHPFFSHVNFDDVLFKRLKAPIMPTLKSKDDISNFAKYPEIWKNNKDEPTYENQLMFDFF